MIKNARAYWAAKTQAEKLRAAIAAADRGSPPKNVDPRIHRASVAAGERQLEELEAELRAFDGLKTAKGKTVLEGRLDDLELLLRQARVARGWTQAELAEVALVHQQKIGQLEAGGYERTSLARIRDVLRGLGVKATIRLELVPLSTAPLRGRPTSESRRALDRRRPCG